MSALCISADSSSEEILPFAKMVHEVVSLPVLEEVFAKNCVIRTMPKRGAYKGIPVVVAPIQDNNGNPIAAVGVIDVISTIDLASVFSDYPRIVKQVEEQKIHKGLKM